MPAAGCPGAFCGRICIYSLSLFPFVTGWMGENHFAAVPSALYGGVLLAAAVTYWILQQAIIAGAGTGVTAEGGDRRRLER
jgi:uncharacterized membrane protein